MVLLVTFRDNFLHTATDHFLLGFAYITTGRTAANLLLNFLVCLWINTEVGAEVEGTILACFDWVFSCSHVLFLLWCFGVHGLGEFHQSAGADLKTQ